MSVTAEGFKGGDKLTLDLPATQRELLAKVASLKKPTVVVLTTGSAINLDDSQAGAVLLAWYYGQRGADAVAEALLGETNPAGRLPITFYRNLDGLPAFDDYAMTNRTYRYYTGKPLYAFGHGLSYTTFEYSPLKLESDTVAVSGELRASLTVTNTGKRRGTEVVQLYAADTASGVTLPAQQLIGFARVDPEPGASKTVSFVVPMSVLAYTGISGDLVMEPGRVEVSAGSSSSDIRSSAKFTITGKTRTIKGSDRAFLSVATVGS